MSQNEKYIAYEYVSLSVDSDMKAVYEDCYQNFGWIIDTLDSTKSITGKLATLKIKRDRRMKNRNELNELQRKCKSALENIYHLEHHKGTKSMIYSLGIGILGTAFMAGSVFCFLGGYMIACISLAVPGFLGWILPYFSFKTIKYKQVAKADQKIDQEYNHVYELCEQANSLL